MPELCRYPIEGIEKQYPVRIGEATFYVESNNMRQFLKGTKQMFLYEVVRTEENATEDTDGAPEVINNYETYLESKIKLIEMEKTYHLKICLKL